MTAPRVLPRLYEMAGATLAVSTSNGYSVHYHGAYVGYIHASIGNQWNAYRRQADGAPAEHLGRFGQEEAVRHIVRGVPASSEGGD